MPEMSIGLANPGWGRRGHKSLFGSFSSEKEQTLLFLKKKKQKDFCFLARFSGNAGVMPFLY
jgi:hypothetical protein